jgi:hypothetical protein
MCYVIPAQHFLETFLPPLKSEGLVPQVQAALMSNKQILTEGGWTKFGQKTRKGKGQLEHKMFNRPLEEIVNTIISSLPIRQGELTLCTILTVLMLWIDGSCTSPPPSPAIRFLNDGFRPFVAERPHSSRTDGALLFLHQSQSHPQDCKRKSKTQTNQRPSLPRVAKVCPIKQEASLKSESRGPVHLEDVIACLQFKTKNEARPFVVVAHQQILTRVLMCRTLLVMKCVISLHIHLLNSRLLQNFLKILLDGLTMMKDPCRRFAYGFTADGTVARFYFFSRAFVFRSESFDINMARLHLWCFTHAYHDDRNLERL